MKKLFAFLTLLTLMLGCFAVTTAAEPAPGKTYQAAWGTPVIDGEVDDVWRCAPVIEMTVSGSPVTAEIRILNDNNYFYVLAVIKDSTRPKYASDRFAVVFDELNCGTTTLCNGKQYINFETMDSGPSTSSSYPGALTYLDEWNRVVTDDTYLYELKLHLTTFMPGSGQTLLMDFFINDKNTANVQVGMLTPWAMPLGHWPHAAEHCSNNFGVVTFATESMAFDPPPATESSEVESSEVPPATTPEATEPDATIEPDASTAPDSSVEDTAPVTTDNKGDDENKDDAKFPVVPVVIAAVIVVAIVVAVVLLKKKK